MLLFAAVQKVQAIKEKARNFIPQKINAPVFLQRRSFYARLTFSAALTAAGKSRRELR